MGSCYALTASGGQELPSQVGKQRYQLSLPSLALTALRFSGSLTISAKAGKMRRSISNSDVSPVSNVKLITGMRAIAAD